MRSGRWPDRARWAWYRRVAKRVVVPRTARGFLPLYREAERVYRVNWRLLASIHRQETAFSAAPSTYHGLNPYGCCAGPMQFNVTNGPVSTWERYRRAFRDGRRPEHYHHRTRRHPSIYDDFDAIMAAGLLLSEAGAGPSLDRSAWNAAYDYYGHDLFGITYANEVLARAEGWQGDGFCPNCSPDESLVTMFENAYGKALRREMLAAEAQEKKEKKRKKRKKRGRSRGDENDRRKARDRAAEERRSRRSKPPASTRPRTPSPPRRRPRRTTPTTPAPTPAQPSPIPPTATPTPAECELVRKLLGCPP